MNASALAAKLNAWVHAGLQGMPDGPRLFFRSAHIYLLWGALLNLLLGCYLVRLERGVLRHVQSFGSLLILAGPFMLCGSFFFEQHNPDLERPSVSSPSFSPWAACCSRQSRRSAPARGPAQADQRQTQAQLLGQQVVGKYWNCTLG